MDNPDPLAHLQGADGDSSGEDDDEVWSMDPNVVSRTDVYELIRDIKDPEHEYTLEALKVVRRRHIEIVNNETNGCSVSIMFTPTVPHCTLATTIGLCIREKLRRDLPVDAKLSIKITPGKHSTEADTLINPCDVVNKQVNDKERVVAALENPELRRLVDSCLNYQPGEY